jgi:transposase
MNNTTRRIFNPQQKAQIVRRHLVGKEIVSNLATEFQVQPSQIHGWVKLLLDQAEAAFQRQLGNRHADESKDRRIAQLEQKLVQKNEVIAELMEENVRSKKANGEL